MRFWSGTVKAAFAALACLNGAAAEPSGFNERTIIKDSFMTDIAFMPNDLMFVTRKVGRFEAYHSL